MISLRPPATEWEIAWKANNEAHPLVNDWRFIGVGLAVHNVSEAASYYVSLGFEPIDEPGIDNSLALQRQRVQVGPLVFEFCQPVGKSSYCGEALNKRGEGVFDLVFQVDNLAHETARLEAHGLKKIAGAEKIACFDTRAEGNTLLRLVA